MWMSFCDNTLFCWAECLSPLMLSIAMLLYYIFVNGFFLVLIIWHTVIVEIRACVLVPVVFLYFKFVVFFVHIRVRVYTCMCGG